MNYLDVLKTTFQEWQEDDAPQLAASLAFYTALSLAPLLLVVLAILGFFFGDEAARGQIVAQLSDELGRDISGFIETVIENSDESSGGILSTVVGLVMLVVGATGVFTQLQSALNKIWDIEVDGGIMVMIEKRLLSFSIIITLAFLLLVSLVINSVISGLDQFLAGLFPALTIVVQIATTLISLGVSILLFAIIYKFMPDAKIKWREVLIGATVTGILFTVGRFILSLYLGNVGVASSFGAAGSFLVILLWVYYSAQIVLFGAEFTQVYARRYGTDIVPEEGAVSLSEDTQATPHDADVQHEPIPDERPVSNPLPLPVQTAERPQLNASMADTATTDRDTDVDRDPVGYGIIVGSFTAVIGAAVGWLLNTFTKGRA